MTGMTSSWSKRSSSSLLRERRKMTRQVQSLSHKRPVYSKVTLIYLADQQCNLIRRFTSLKPTSLQPSIWSQKSKKKSQRKILATIRASRPTRSPSELTKYSSASTVTSKPPSYIIWKTMFTCIVASTRTTANTATRNFHSWLTRTDTRKCAVKDMRRQD